MIENFWSLGQGDFPADGYKFEVYLEDSVVKPENFYLVDKRISILRLRIKNNHDQLQS